MSRVRVSGPARGIPVFQHFFHLRAGIFVGVKLRGLVFVAQGKRQVIGA
ncbi:hypothetical protein [Roseibium sp. MB-4]